MNNLTRRFVYPSLLFAFAATAAIAEPVGVHALETPKKVYTGLTTSADSAPGDITLSSFSDLASAIVQSPDSKTGKATDLSIMTPTDGKVSAIESGSRTTTTAAPDMGAQVISDASEAVSQSADPSDISNATSSSSATGNSGSNDIIISLVGTPEPSTLLLVGSIFVVAGIYRRKRQPQS